MYGTEKSFGRDSQNSQYYGESSYHHDGLGRRVMDSFKRDPNFSMTPKGSLGADGKVFDVESAAQNTANSPLARKLKGRHLQMIAIGGSIGISTFLPISIPSHPILMVYYRYWSLRWFRSSTCGRWTCKSRDSLLSSRHHVVLHRSCTRRNGRPLSSRRFLLRILDSLLRSRLGFRNGLEVSYHFPSPSVPCLNT